jgi:aminopeptidase N
MYARFLELSENPANPLDRDRYLYSLAAFESESLVKRTLDFALSPRARAQDVLGLVFTAFENPTGTRVAWEFLKPNYDALVSKAGPMFGTGLVSVVGSACEPEIIANMEAFFAEKKLPGVERSLQQGLERARNCAGLKQRQQRGLHEWLSQRPRTSEQ